MDTWIDRTVGDIRMNKIVKGMIAMGFAMGMANSAFSAEALKLGYLVKQPEEPWFQTEWNFADKAGKDLGFEVIKIAVPDGEKTLNAIDSLAANGAKGFVICTLTPSSGPPSWPRPTAWISRSSRWTTSSSTPRACPWSRCPGDDGRHQDW